MSFSRVGTSFQSCRQNSLLYPTRVHAVHLGPGRREGQVSFCEAVPRVPASCAIQGHTCCGLKRCSTCYTHYLHRVNQDVCMSTADICLKLCVSGWFACVTVHDLSCVQMLEDAKKVKHCFVLCITLTRWSSVHGSSQTVICTRMLKPYQHCCPVKRPSDINATDLTSLVGILHVRDCYGTGVTQSP